MMENRERDDLNALTSQVLEYYKTYSQNRNFSSYLRGTIPNVESGDSINTIEVREVANDEEETTPFLSVQSDNDENNINLGNVSEEQGRIPSPTSSVTSNRKLEWDNLADIGYGNCRKQKNLHKSLSLPLLTTLEKIQLGQRKLRASPESNVIDHGTQTQGIIKNSPLESISSESYKKSSLLSTNTTTSYTENVPTIDTSSTVSSLSKLVSLRTESDLTDVEYTVVDNKVVNRLEKYIGLPMAESTPNNVKDGGNSSKTGKIKEDKDVLNPDEKLPNNKENLINTKNEESPVESGNVTELKCVAKCFRNNIKHLSLTKPLTVECYAHKEISDKDMQTSTVNEIKTTSIAIQTDDCPENDDTVIEHKICPVYEDRRIIEYVKHSDFPDEPSSRSVGTNTNSDVRISQCNSFEYLYGAQISDRSKSQSNTPSHSDESKNERKRTATETDRTSDLSSKANPLAELISAKLSQHVVNDVDKSIIILQKLLKSKKYDKVTKQYYIKKIAQKIINCNYSSQSSTNSVTSSETTDDNQNQSDTANLPNTDKPLKISKTQQHQEAMPQVPVISNSNENLKTAKRRQLDIKTFSTEILPEKPMIESSIKPQKSSKLKDARFTIASKYNQYATSDELSQIGDVIPDLPSLPSSPQQTTVETSGSSRKSSFKNWKEHATKSEKLLEDKLNRIHSTDTTSDDSELLNFAKKERENQISWINNEINHLNKLKDMLQKKKKRQIPNVEALIQPQVEDMTEKNKTTSVYVITTERSSATSSGTYKTVERSNESRDASKKCECLYAKCGSLPCDSSDCPLLNYNSDKSSKKSDFGKKKDIDMVPQLTSLPGFERCTGIENARLIASEIYPGETPNSCVRRYVFEMPMDVEEHTVQKQCNEFLHEKYICKPSIPKLPGCNIKADTGNAKLIATEICKGSLPNTCIRRYIFEIPVCDEDEASRISCRACSPRFVEATPVSSSYKKSSYSVETTVTCRHRRLDKPKPCDCKPKPSPRVCKCKEPLPRLCNCKEPLPRLCNCKEPLPRLCNCKEPPPMKDEEIQIDIAPAPAPSPPPPPPRKKPSDVVCIYESDDEEVVAKLMEEYNVSSDVKQDFQIAKNKKTIGSQNSKISAPSKIAPGYKIREAEKTIGSQNGKNSAPSKILPGYQIDETEKTIGTQYDKNLAPSKMLPGYQIGETEKTIGTQYDKNLAPSKILPGYQIGETEKTIGTQYDKNLAPSKILPGCQIGGTEKTIGTQYDKNLAPSKILPGYQIGEAEKTIATQYDKNVAPSKILPGCQIGGTEKTIGSRNGKKYGPSHIALDPQIGQNGKAVESENDRYYQSSDIGGHQVDGNKKAVGSQNDQNQSPSDVRYVYQIGENESKKLSVGIVQTGVVADPHKEYQISIDQTEGGGGVSYVEYSGISTKGQKYEIPDIKQQIKYHAQSYNKQTSTEDLQPYLHKSPKKTVTISDQKTFMRPTVDDNNVIGGKIIPEGSQEYTDTDGAALSSGTGTSLNVKSNYDESPSTEISSCSNTEHCVTQAESYPIDKSREKDLEKGDFAQKVHSSNDYDNRPYGDRLVSIKSPSAKTYKDQMIHDTEIKNYRKKLQEVDKKKHKSGPTRKPGQDTSSAVDTIYNTSQSSTYSDKTATSTDFKTDDKTRDTVESTSLGTKGDEKSQEAGESTSSKTQGDEKPKKERVPLLCFKRKKPPPPVAEPPPDPPTPKPEPPVPRQDRGINTDNIETDTDSSESSDSSENIPRLCLCCNTAEAKYRSRLRGLPDQLQRALCDPCFVQNRQVTAPGTRPYYTYPGHVCCCYTMIKTETVRNIQRTVQELEDLERERNCCSCTYGCKLHKHTGKRGNCSKAVAYTLTFEDVEKSESEYEHRRRHRRPPLEEVRVKVPYFVKKSKKDRENRKKSKHAKHKKHHKNDEETKTLTLQDHLVTNRPNFVANAEERRKALIELAYMREERCQKYKQLLAMSNGAFSERNFNNKLSKPHMFSSKEMKKITANNYKKLPEVQKKLEENRYQQIKRANKILSDMFNKKLRERVLKGKLSLSTNTSVIKLC